MDVFPGSSALTVMSIPSESVESQCRMPLVSPARPKLVEPNTNLSANTPTSVLHWQMKRKLDIFLDPPLSERGANVYKHFFSFVATAVAKISLRLYEPSISTG